MGNIQSWFQDLSIITRILTVHSKNLDKLCEVGLKILDV